MIRRIRNADKRQPIYSGVAGKVAKLLDMAVGLALPQVAHRMRVSRMQSEALLAYESATFSRTNPSQTSSSADGEILPDLKKLRDVSRNTVRDDAHASSAVQILEENIVGRGIRPKSVCDPAETGLSAEQCDAWNRAVDAEFERWADEEADATGQGDFYDLQSLALRSFVVDGEAIGHAVLTDDSLSCELIDPDRVQSPGMFDSIDVRSGVEIDDAGRPKRFWILKHHPDDFMFRRGADLKPVAHDVESDGYTIITHVFRRIRAGQTRGVPWLASALGYLGHLHHYLNSELIGARAASNFALFIKRSVTPDDQGIFPVQGSENPAQSGDFHEFLEPGTIEYLNDGEEPFSYTPNRPGTAFEPFVIRILRAIAASLGLAYEVVAKDFGRMNLSSARALLRECQRGYDKARKIFNRQWNDPWRRNVIRVAIASGRLTPPATFLDNERAFMRCRWVAPSYGMVDPVSDVEASVAAIAANLSTPFEEASRNGTDAVQVLRERARFAVLQRETEVEFGLPAGTLAATAPDEQVNPGAPAAKSESEDLDVDEESADDEAADAPDSSNADGDRPGKRGPGRQQPKASSSTDGNEDANRKALVDAIGVAVRSGLLTPAQEVEEHVRVAFGMPPISDAVKQAWKDSPTRRPVTIAGPEGSAPTTETDGNNDA